MIPKTSISKPQSFHNGSIQHTSVNSPEQLAIAAHEIRNPAQALIGLTDMLCGMALSAEAQACARVIKQSAHAILAVVDDALDLVRLQQGFIDFVAEPFDPRALVAGTVEMLHRQAEAKGLDLAGFTEADLPGRMIGDAARIRQILLNLAGNAIKFTEEGGVGIALRRSADGALCFIVEDTGPGLGDADRAALFEAFASTGHDRGGLGLGLTVSAGIASALGGELSVEARPGGGSRFIFTLQCPATDDRPAEATPESERRPVLIVSSSPFTGPYLVETLCALGHTAERIEQPDRAGTWLAGHPDAVMLADAALGRRALKMVINRARAAGCERIALLRSLKEGQEARALADATTWPVIRKPVSGRQISLRLEAIGRQATPPSRQTGPVALVADDCPVNRLLACRLLEQEGFRTVAVADGTEAVDHVAQRLADGSDPFTLILIDRMMPGLDGVLTTRHIRGVEALFRAPPAYIAGLSALVERDDIAEGRAEGMDDVVPKPLTTAILLRLRDAAAEKSVTRLSDMCKTRTAAARSPR